MIDFDALAGTPLQQIPYEWALVEDAFDRERAPALIDTFPTRDFWQIAGHDGEKSYTYDARPLVICGADRPVNLSPFADPWQEVVDDLLSPNYREALSTAIGRPLDDALMEANVWRWPNEAHLGPHLDMEQKIVTQVFYLNAGWNPWWGGCLRILKSKDEHDLASEIPPRLGNASILVRSDRSWHTVSPVSAAPVPRRSLIVTWFQPGSRSPTWYEDADGAVRTFAEPPGAIRHGAPIASGLASLEAHAAATDARCAELTAFRHRKSVRAALRTGQVINRVRAKAAARIARP
ncbi:MAG: 2OG-Fe(II) oxygenase [Chloroflexota bacterium]|nr:2OG-Fe(II) oxygenase [Chloroflexota bacterium]MDQ2939928.1 2OG-Fe(II) oxygenase [Actinomycetota bacterium]